MQNSDIVNIFKNFKQGSIDIKPPYIIAEVGVNHEGKMSLAKRLIDDACDGGANVIKFQTYKAESIASKNSPAYWDKTKEPTKTQFQLFKKYDTFWKKEFEELKIYCDNAGIEFLSTPFDMESARFLNDLMSVFKISSSDITNKPFIEYICSFKKPIILSTGASYLYEIEEAVSWIEQSGNPLALLHCVLNYPTKECNANLGMICHLKAKFPEYITGYSDHTLPLDMKVLETAVILGASIIEKHFTHDKNLPGNDHYHAMDKEDLKIFLKNIKRTIDMIGRCKITSLPNEELSRKNARRSLVTRCKIPKGKKIDKEDLTWKRPAHGISPKYIDAIIGKKTSKAINEDTILQWNMFSIQ